MGVFSDQIKKPSEPTGKGNITPNNGQNPSNGGSYELKSRIHRHLIDRIDLSKVDVLPRDLVEQQIRGLVEELLAEEETPLSRWERDQIVLEIQHETFGLGPLKPLPERIDLTLTDQIEQRHLPSCAGLFQYTLDLGVFHFDSE